MKPRVDRVVELANLHNFICDCISCDVNWPAFNSTGNQTLDVSSCRLLALMDGVPEQNFTKLMPVTREELRLFEKAAVNFLQKNDHLHPTMETMKIQFVLTQIWYLLMR